MAVDTESEHYELTTSIRENFVRLYHWQRHTSVYEYECCTLVLIVLLNYLRGKFRNFLLAKALFEEKMNNNYIITKYAFNVAIFKNKTKYSILG